MFLLLDKNSFLGGNSTKATSGIAGALTQTQMKLGIQDSAAAFYEDAARSARDRIRPELVKVLTYESGPAIDWLQTRFNLDLSKVARLGGHSFPRVHRGPERFPGMTITYALMEKLEEICKNEPHRARVITKAKVTGLITEPGNSTSVVGAKYEKDGQTFEEHGYVIIATGGFGADFGDDSLLKKYRPEFLHLPTTNGDHCTGDGIKISEAVGANSVDMEMVQVHPTGLVDLNEPDAKIKFLAAEALRGVGGILLNADGHRFCDELGHRDYVTGEMWKSKGPFRLILNSAASKEIEWHCKHYIGRGLMKKYASGAALAKDMGISVDTLKATFEKYNEYAKDPKKDPFGKKYFHNVSVDVNDEFCVSIVTPVVHYCMGGLEVNANAEVKNKSGVVIQGLYASGEVVGGVHGANRLGGNSLLDCVVYGRVAGASAAAKVLQTLSSQKSGNRLGSLANQVLSATISQNGVQTRVEVDPKTNKLSLEVSWDKNTTANATSTSTVSAPSTPAAAPAAAAAPAPPAQNKLKEYTVEEVAKHNKESDCWVIVNGQVLDVTHFLKDHPGGKKAILLFAGRDATAEFNMLHKPDVIEKYAPESVIGVIKGGDQKLQAKL
eukprot:TRINITY_DN6680_c0_g1_i1.p1 TRINITY_DN6680_c0_g1~~TRINITY_DN6680_c0_g1_i1.p1  ORF type:complete len:647 (-),score=162.21 TRINITY_DN6680_c0_g1_i1:62-1891(-)